MTKQEILRSGNFEEVAEARVDAKRRVALGRTLSQKVTSYRIYRNGFGQMILDPMVTIPAHEAWLFKNTRATRLVKQGLSDARKGRLVKAKEDYRKYARSRS